MHNELDPRCAEWANLHTSGGGSMTWRQIAEQYGETRETVKKRVWKWTEASKPGAPPSGEPSVMVVEESVTPIHANGEEVKGDIIFEDKKPLPSDGDVQALLDAYLQVMDKAKPLSTRQRFANVTLTGNLPVGIVHFSDQHIGSWSWAARQMIADYHTVGTTDGVYCNFIGDDFDNFIFNFAKWASVMTPDHQKKIAGLLMRRVYEKTIAVVAGNHLHWTKKSADVDHNADLAALSNAVFLGHRGDVNVSVGEQTYALHLCHLAQGRSSVNKSNSGRRNAENYPGRDVIVEGDAHDPWEHQEYKGGKRQVWHRSGTYKLDDDYTDEQGFQQGHADMPMDILLPDTHKVIPYMDFRDGLDNLEFLRAKYRKGAM